MYVVIAQSVCLMVMSVIIQSGSTALIEAARKGYMDCVECLVQAGAVVDSQDEVSEIL